MRRWILDASLTANEMVEENRKKKEKGQVIKIDMEKANNRVDYQFLDKTWEARGFRHTGLKVTSPIHLFHFFLMGRPGLEGN